MSEDQFIQNKINQENSQNKLQENQISSSIINNKDLERNNLINNQNKNEELGIGQFILTPLQSILINKKMPFGFKLETEENIFKSIETTKIQTKKSKNSSKHKEKIGKDHHNMGGSIQPKKRVSNNFDIPSNYPPEIKTVLKKCRIGLDRIKESKYINIYYHSNNPDVPCLANIEKKVNNFEYRNLYDFQMDVRNVWSYHFKLQQNNEITSKMSADWEKICADLDNQNFEMNTSYIKERTDKIQKELDNINAARNMGNIPAPGKKNTQQNMKLNNKGMSVEEKNKLGNDIRTLNKEQLKGIIKILSENKEYPKSKYFEFDIDKLSIEKLRELDKYVKECLNSNKLNSTNSSNNNISNNNIHKQNSNNKLQNQNNKSNNKGNNTPNQQLLKSNNKDMNKTQDNKSEQLAKKIKPSSNKKSEKNNESFSSESISSDSSLSN